MRNELYVHFLLAGSETARETFRAWLRRQPLSGTFDMANPWLFRRLAAKRNTTVEALFAELRELLDAPFRVVLAPIGIEDAARLTDRATIATIERALGRPGAGEKVLDELFSAPLLGDSLGFDSRPATVREAVARMLEAYRDGEIQYKVFYATHWVSQFRSAMNPEPGAALRRELRCAEGEELQTLLGRKRPEGRLLPEDELSQPLDFLSVDRIRSVLRQLVLDALAMAVSTAEKAAQLRPEEAELVGLPAAISWFGAGDYRTALGQLEAADPAPSDQEGARRTEDPDRARLLAVLEQLTRTLPQGTDEQSGGTSLTPAELLEALSERSACPTLWRAALDQPMAVAVIVLGGLEPDRAGLERPEVADVAAFPSPPEPLPDHETVTGETDPFVWLTEPGGILEGAELE